MNKIESMLLELKDTSEFMIDLAYSSLLYNNVEIAEEVEFLEKKPAGCPELLAKSWRKRSMMPL